MTVFIFPALDLQGIAPKWPSSYLLYRCRKASLWQTFDSIKLRRIPDFPKWSWGWKPTSYTCIANTMGDHNAQVIKNIKKEKSRHGRLHTENPQQFTVQYIWIEFSKPHPDAVDKICMETRVCRGFSYLQHVNSCVESGGFSSWISPFPRYEVNSTTKSASNTRGFGYGFVVDLPWNNG